MISGCGNCGNRLTNIQERLLTPFGNEPGHALKNE
jgi:hypothetical protein